MNHSPTTALDGRFCMSAGGGVYIGVPPTGVPDVHDLIISGQLEKALSVVAKGTGDRVLAGVRGNDLPPTIPIPKILIKRQSKRRL